MNQADNRDDRIIEHAEEEHISTADLAGATHAKEGRRDGGEQHIDGTPVEIVRSPDGEREPDRPRTSAASSAAEVPDRSGETLRDAAAENSGPLFPSDEARKLRQRWDAIQVGFVDEPRRSVEEADSLVATVMKRLAEQFSVERSKLEGNWDRGSDLSTEDLRVALRRYRSFFGRLLNV